MNIFGGEDRGVNPNIPLISQVFTKEELKMYCYHACRVDIPDNNDKAEMLEELLGPEFQEIGTGTNRVAFLYTPSESREFRGGSGLIYKFALDRRGFIDNWTCYKRASELPMYSEKIYECNLIINVEEYVNLMNADEFRYNEIEIKSMLKDIAKSYIFDDIGYSMKNYENFGYRENGEIVCLDMGYVYPIAGNEQALTCEACGSPIKYNENFTKFICQNTACRHMYENFQVRSRMNFNMDNFEDQIIMKAKKTQVPDFHHLNLNTLPRGGF